MLWLSRKDIEHISRRLLRDYLKKVPQKVDHIDPADFAEKMCGLQFTFADISEAHDAIGLTATSGVIITIPQRDGTRLDYELDGKTAFIDQSLVAENQIGRLNFTMMHEAAHQLFGCCTRKNMRCKLLAAYSAWQMNIRNTLFLIGRSGRPMC